MQNVVESGTASAGKEFLLPSEHIDLVIVGGVQRGRSRRRHPCAVGTSLRVTDLLFEHVGHTVRGRPHALADLGLAVQTTGQADVDVPVFVGADPVLSLHVTLANERASFHRCVDFVAGAVEETGVDEHHPTLDRPNAFLEVHGGATFFVHQAELDRVRGEAQDLFNSTEDLVGECGFVGSVHLRLYDIDRAGARVLVTVGFVEIVFGTQHSHHRVE